jgi:glycosyltransferase involved in cell wall biosynthesis
LVAIDSINNHNSRLAFVIPAFKGRYLADTLDSLAEQSNQNFQVYIGDDASPDNLEQIVAPYRDRLNLHYHRFNDNLGGNSLVKQWERCVALSNEPFFCLFADDDVLHRNCVDDFYSVINESKKEYDVYRFNNAVIDELGEMIAYTAAPFRPESHTSFLLTRMHNRRVSFISSYIINRDAYLREKGFVDFPLAWFSDDASIILFSKLTGICNIPGHPVYWRLGGQNISAPNKNTYFKKITAAIRYTAWIADRFDHITIGADSWDSKKFKTLTEKWFFRQLDCAGCYPLGMKELLSISSAISPYCRSNTSALFLKLHCHIRRKRRLGKTIGTGETLWKRTISST